MLRCRRHSLEFSRTMASTACINYDDARAPAHAHAPWKLTWGSEVGDPREGFNFLQEVESFLGVWGRETPS